ncbi:MAG: DUF4339 domain-containing protein [Rhodospirillaceae bacterium]|jgi:hypothetical protein|nr:DUF4339 domain-containing protein [Rhodospirillaceae bacterium]MBT5374138.1 DUF4339 domain-containing protein [Rhodospirillaceae bacterium]MBT5752549.1 DUF4339 domain-containing protein [Rhodospirillaceae bacterium]
MNTENNYCPDEEDPWFYIDGDKQQAGPVTKEYLIEMIKSGIIRDDPLVRSGYYIHWQQASKTPELFPPHKQQHSVANSLKNSTFSEKSTPPKKIQNKKTQNKKAQNKKVQNKKAQNKLIGTLGGEKPMPLMGSFTDPFFLAAALGVFLFTLWLP